MSKALDKTLKKFRRRQEDKPIQWQGRVNYHSPRSAESWDSPDRLLSFDSHSGEGAKKVMEAYREQLLTERGIVKPSQDLKQRTQHMAAGQVYRPQFSLQSDSQTRLSPFEEAFRVSPDADTEGERDAPWSWLRRLFSR